MLSTHTPPRASRAVTESRRESANEMQAVVQRLLAGKQNAQGVGERRRQQRTPYPYLIKLAPVAADGETPVGEGFVVVGKHLSIGGIDFYHREPLPYRWTIVWLECGGTTQAMLVELLWCRFNKQGWYENGGRFVRLINDAESLQQFAD